MSSNSPNQDFLQIFEKSQKLNICPNRLWAAAGENLARILPDLDLLARPNKPDDDAAAHANYSDHNNCTPDFCEYSQLDFTSVQQRHECADSKQCMQMKGLFRKDVLEDAVINSSSSSTSSTAWALGGEYILQHPHPYMAISHVWSDGTGTGVSGDETINECMYNFFADIALQFQCRGIWWDTLCIPREKTERNKAIRKIQACYENARITLVHDCFLRNWEWDADTACFAILMSPWFSRGWTALELLKSRKVKIIFRKRNGGYIIKDLDEEILAQEEDVESPRKEASRVIRRLRNGITTLNDLLNVLGSRSTSWPKDVPLISALLLDVKAEEQQQDTYQNILRKLGKLAPGHLFHNAITMTNGFNWCPVTLFKMPLDASEPSLSFLSNGDVRGSWRVISVPPDLERNCLLNNMHYLTRCQIQDALRYSSECRLLAECNQGLVERALLVREITENRFQYIAALTLYQALDTASSWEERTVTILSNPHGKDNVVPIDLDKKMLTMSCHDETLHSAIWKGDYDAFKELIKSCSADTPDQLGRRPLHLAAERGNRQIVKDLLSCKPDLNAQCDHGQTALHRAAWGGSASVVKLLLNKDADTMIQDKDGNTALHIASQMGFADVASLLITTQSDLTNFKGCYDLTPLHLAAMNGHMAVAEVLIDTAADMGVRNMHFGWTPLHCAVDSGDERLVKLLIDHGADVDVQDSMVGWSPLHFASMHGHTAVVGLLLERGASSADKDMSGWTPRKFAEMNGHSHVLELLPSDDSIPEEASWTPLHCRAFNNQPNLTKILTSPWPVLRMYVEGMTTFRTPLEFAAMAELEFAVQRLFDAGITIKAEAEGETPLHWAVTHGCRAFTQVLLKASGGVDKEATTTEDGDTPLHLAGKFGRPIVAQLLLEAGAGKETINKFEETPLHQAVLGGDTRVVRLLVKAGVNKDAVADYGRTPLLYAVQNGHESIVRLLVEAGANKETADKDNWTPLHWAVQNGHEDIVRLLMDAGANQEESDNKRYTPLALAAELGHEAIVRLLVEAGTYKRVINGMGGAAPLWRAVRQGHEKVVRMLVAAGANIDEQNVMLEETPLVFAAQKGYGGIVRLLVEAGANIEATDYRNATALLWAARLGHEEIVRLLVEKGANTEVMDQGQQPLPKSIVARFDIGGNEDDMETYRKLKDDARKSDIGPTPLAWAAKGGHEGVVRLLVEAGADMEAVDALGLTPLHWAVHEEHEAIVRVLVQAGSNMEAVDREKQTALHMAMYYQNEGIVRFLVEAGANKEATDDLGFMPQDINAGQHLKELCGVTSLSARRKAMLTRTTYKAIGRVANAMSRKQ